VPKRGAPGPQSAGGQLGSRKLEAGRSGEAQDTLDGSGDETERVCAVHGRDVNRAQLLLKRLGQRRQRVGHGHLDRLGGHGVLDLADGARPRQLDLLAERGPPGLELDHAQLDLDERPSRLRGGPLQGERLDLSLRLREAGGVPRRGDAGLGRQLRELAPLRGGQPPCGDLVVRL
jgi:hypothetical protein